jgi:hypothetical protein
MAKKSQSVKDRLAAYRTKPARRSFFDALSADAKTFALEARDLFRAGELELGWKDLYRACTSEFPGEAWPTTADGLVHWFKKGDA